MAMMKRADGFMGGMQKRDKHNENGTQLHGGKSDGTKAMDIDTNGRAHSGENTSGRTAYG